MLVKGSRCCIFTVTCQDNYLYQEMKGTKYIQTKQIQWALRSGIALTGSQAGKGLNIYTRCVDDNLFEPMTQETINQIKAGDGGELRDSKNNAAKMRALHSSSAIGVNFFQYPKSQNKVSQIAHACRLCNSGNTSSVDVNFEKKYPISNTFSTSPNIDVVIENDENSRFRVYAIECKYSEAYGSYKHSGVDPKYLSLGTLWKNIPNTLDLARRISPNDNEYKYLHSAQLIKHILGLKKKYGKTAFRLLYLWYDVLGEEGNRHRNEIEKFTSVVKSDGIIFSSITYQEVITNLSSSCYSGNEKYINYLSDRYL